ncbi:MAG: Nif3-like dinuclear metal center hexameric protein [Phycisphaerae bacterium]|jgi:dinuclear metal center YbgI/SA1388 family protein
MARVRTRATIREVAAVLDDIAPPALAQPWDNVGLLAGDPAAICRRVLLCVDLTPAVLEEAVRKACDLAVAYHPPIFKPVRRLVADKGEPGALVYRAVSAGLAIYSPHTALDAAEGGTNDVLADLCGLRNVEPFEYVTTGRAQVKLVTFVPAQRVDAVAAAMSSAGAGHIGDYRQCSFRSAGTGTFFGLENTRPRVGEKGRLERVEEIRLEMVCPAERVPEVTAALRGAHPYEEPAFDLYPLAPEPAKGIGRVGRLPGRTTLGTLARRLQKATGSQIATLVGRGGSRVSRAAVCAGSAGMLPFEKARSADCDVIVTGEIRHHDALAMQRRNVAAIALGHWESERPVLRSLARRLKAAMPPLQTAISLADVPPFQRA